jgi:hypothetical protein
MRAMTLRLLTVLAVAMLAFYAGVRAEDARAPSYSISVPKTIPITPTPPTGVRVVETTSYGFAESRSDRLAQIAAIGAAVGALFLLARLVVIVVRRRRAASQP